MKSGIEALHEASNDLRIDLIDQLKLQAIEVSDEELAAHDLTQKTINRYVLPAALVNTLPAHILAKIKTIEILDNQAVITLCSSRRAKALLKQADI